MTPMGMAEPEEIAGRVRLRRLRRGPVHDRLDRPHRRRPHGMSGPEAPARARRRRHGRRAGLGRAHAFAFAAEGARVVVNDLGTSLDRRGDRSESGRRGRPTRSVAAGGEAVVNARRRHRLGRRRPDDRRRRSTPSAASTRSCATPASCATGCSSTCPSTSGTHVMRVHLRGMFCPVRHAVDYWRAEREGRPPAAPAS